MKLGNYHNVFFVGIGGIGMSALARWFKKEGLNVQGYDKTETPLTKQLVKESIEVFYDDALENISKEYSAKENTLVIYTPAIPKDSILLNYFFNNGFEVVKRAKALGIISEGYKTIGVAGTHGKTTTSSILAHLLYQANRNVTCFVGGVLKNYDSNLIYRNDGEGEHIVVVEADEFDRSFLQLKPDMAIVTTVDPDHLDIYQDEETFYKAFDDYVSLLPENGLLVKNECVDRAFDLVSNQCVYGEAKEAQAINVRVGNGYQVFDYKRGESVVADLEMYVPGYHNVMNTVAAITVALELGLTKDEIQKGVASYRGVKRRFEYVVKTNDFAYIDDYAHHPSEVKAFVSSVRELFVDKKVTVVFQPHLFSRTQDFADDFAEELSKVDELILLDIYPARELPIEGVTSEWLFSKIKNGNKRLVKDVDLMDCVRQLKTDVLVTLGAGDIDRFVNQIKEEKAR